MMDYVSYDIVLPEEGNYLDGGLRMFDDFTPDQYTGMIDQASGITGEGESVLIDKPKKEKDLGVVQLSGLLITPNKRHKTMDYSGYKGIKAFNEAYDKVEKYMPEAAKYRKVLTEIAKNESGFNSGIKNQNAPAYGYFQFMQDGNKYNNITAYSGLDIQSFLASPEKQIESAVKMAKDIERGLSKDVIAKAKQMGYNTNALIGGAWLGGNGGLKKYFLQGINIDDKHWSPDSSGIDMTTQLNRYNFD